MPDRIDFNSPGDNDNDRTAYEALAKAKALYAAYYADQAKAESPEERRRKFFLIRGGRALVAAPVVFFGWLGREFRAHATATVTATAVVVGGGVGLAAVTTIGGGVDPVQATMGHAIARPIQTPRSTLAPPAALDAETPQPVPPLPAGALTLLFDDPGTVREVPIDLDVIPVDDDGNPLPIPEPTLPPVLPPLDDGREPGTVPTIPPVETEPIIVEPPPVDDGREEVIEPPFIEPPIDLPPFLDPPEEEEEEEPPVILPPVDVGDGRGEEGDGRG